MKTYLSVTFFIFMAVVQLYRPETDRFSLVVSSPSIFGHVGEDIVLPCALSSNISAEGMEIRWLKQEKEYSVLIFVSQDHNENELNKGYQERTELFKPGLQEGDVSLLLKSVKISDRGNYTCSVITSDWFSDASLSLEVIVTGNTPLISLNGHKGVGIELSCISVGWHPIPQVQWLDVADTDISARSNTELVMDQDELYNVKSNLEVSQKDSDGIVCRVRGVQRQPESYIEIREELFHTSSSWKTAFAVTFLFLLLTLGLLGAVFLYWMKSRVIQESEKKVEESCQETTAKLAESEKLLAEEKDMRIKHLESEITQIKKDKENLTKRRDSDIQQIKDEKNKHIRRLETEIEKSKKEENNLKEQLETAKSENEKLKQDCSNLHNEITLFLSAC
ncbi:butyrophilin subfamily 3 member A2-like isoform X2 [Polypterus senegalus]|uniref:butyrophilin subfamily 3 member A2-like isoform X2 n=1 Tax=Polypterus senegalus TaxID=55291 RepID=UPI0019651D6C|nr:butyrophilin subfamily 3 member A2-like isoform X2 [Polypterus senegalus]